MSRQAVYQAEHRLAHRHGELILVKEKVQQVRRYMPKLGTRKLHYMLASELQELGIKNMIVEFIKVP